LVRYTRPEFFEFLSEVLFTPFGELGSGSTEHIVNLCQGEIRVFCFFASRVVVVPSFSGENSATHTCTFLTVAGYPDAFRSAGRGRHSGDGLIGCSGRHGRHGTRKGLRKNKNTSSIHARFFDGTHTVF
jgi:hypothetical protein